MVVLDGFGIAGRVKFAVSAGTDEVFGEGDGQAEEFVEHGGEEGVGIVCAFGESAKKLLVHFRSGHQTVHVQTTNDLEAGHVSFDFVWE